MIPDTLDHTTQGELQRYENKYEALNLITTVLGRNVYDRVAHLETAHDVYKKVPSLRKIHKNSFKTSKIHIFSTTTPNPVILVPKFLESLPLFFYAFI
jgi:hypothetical protein